MKNLLLVLLMMVAVNSTAATISESTSARVDAEFIDFGATNLDLNTGLEWLVFSTIINGVETDYTLGHSIESASAAYVPQGFRMATEEDVFGLFDMFFPTFAATDAAGRMEIDDLADPTADIVEERNSWLMSFGTYIDSEGDLHSRGWYLDGNGDAQIMGAILNTNPLSSYLYGPDYDLTSYSETSAFSHVGVFMVRDYIPAVPVPAAVWLFASGLLGLVAVARRKKV